LKNEEPHIFLIMVESESPVLNSEQYHFAAKKNVGAAGKATRRWQELGPCRWYFSHQTTW